MSDISQNERRIVEAAIRYVEDCGSGSSPTSTELWRAVHKHESTERTRSVLDADAGSHAARIPVRQQHSGAGGETTRGNLPVWLDADGCIRIAISVREPKFSYDADQIIVRPEDLFAGLSTAFERKP